MNVKQQRGFTLIEMAIVLAVVGLIVGSILGGQSMIRSARLKMVVNDLKRYDTAIQTFRNKYKSWPGDMLNATTVWGAASSCPGGTGSGTCNGNGDQRIAYLSANYNESYRLWQQLFYDALIPARVTGVSTGATTTLRSSPGTNVPQGPIEATGYTVMFASGLTNIFPSLNGNVMVYGLEKTNDITKNPAFTPAEAYDIDTKMDDGKPAYGVVQQFTSTGQSHCANSSTATTAIYEATWKPVTCPLIYRISSQAQNY